MPQQEPHRGPILNPSSVLGWSCTSGLPAIVLNLEQAQVFYPVRFASMANGSITLDVLEEIGALSKGTRCCVSFAYKGNARAFFSSVLEYRDQPAPQFAQLILQAPSEIVGVTPRTAYRVPVVQGAMLSVRLLKGDEMTTADPIDLSLTGTLIEFRKVPDPNLPCGAQIGLELQLGIQTARLKAEVRHRDGHRYGSTKLSPG